MTLVRTAAERRYLWRTIAACGAYAVTLVLANYLIEVVHVAPPAAIANAVSDALSPLGIEIDTLPATPERIFRLVEAARSGGGMV